MQGTARVLLYHLERLRASTEIARTLFEDETSVETTFIILPNDALIAPRLTYRVTRLEAIKYWRADISGSCSRRQIGGMNERERAGAIGQSALRRRQITHVRPYKSQSVRTRAAFGFMQALETSTMSDDEYMSTGDLNDDDEDYRPRASPVPTVGPLLPVKQQKKRGRKPNPNPSIRTAREAARKANHSVIEYVLLLIVCTETFAYTCL